MNFLTKFVLRHRYNKNAFSLGYHTAAVNANCDLLGEDHKAAASGAQSRMDEIVTIWRELDGEPDDLTNDRPFYIAEGADRATGKIEAGDLLV